MYYCNGYYKKNNLIEHAENTPQPKKNNFISLSSNPQLFNKGEWYSSYNIQRDKNIDTLTNYRYNDDIANFKYDNKETFIFFIIDNNYNCYEIILGKYIDLPEKIDISLPNLSPIKYYLIIIKLIKNNDNKDLNQRYTNLYISEIPTSKSLIINIKNINNNTNIYTIFDFYKIDNKSHFYNNIKTLLPYVITLSSKDYYYTNNSELVKNNKNIKNIKDIIFDFKQYNYFIYSIIDSYFNYYNVNIIYININTNIPPTTIQISKISKDLNQPQYYFIIQKIYYEKNKNNNYEYRNINNIFIQLLSNDNIQNIDISKFNFDIVRAPIYFPAILPVPTPTSPTLTSPIVSNTPTPTAPIVSNTPTPTAPIISNTPTSTTPTPSIDQTNFINIINGYTNDLTKIKTELSNNINDMKTIEALTKECNKDATIIINKINQLISNTAADLKYLYKPIQISINQNIINNKKFFEEFNNFLLDFNTKKDSINLLIKNENTKLNNLNTYITNKQFTQLTQTVIKDVSKEMLDITSLSQDISQTKTNANTKLSEIQSNLNSIKAVDYLSQSPIQPEYLKINKTQGTTIIPYIINFISANVDIIYINNNKINYDNNYNYYKFCIVSDKENDNSNYMFNYIIGINKKVIDDIKITYWITKNNSITNNYYVKIQTTLNNINYYDISRKPINNTFFTSKNTNQGDDTWNAITYYTPKSNLLVLRSVTDTYKKGELVKSSKSDEGISYIKYKICSRIYYNNILTDIYDNMDSSIYRFKSTNMLSDNDIMNFTFVYPISGLIVLQCCDNNYEYYYDVSVIYFNNILNIKYNCSDISNPVLNIKHIIYPNISTDNNNIIIINNTNVNIEPTNTNIIWNFNNNNYQESIKLINPIMAKFKYDYAYTSTIGIYAFRIGILNTYLNTIYNTINFSNIITLITKTDASIPSLCYILNQNITKQCTIVVQRYDNFPYVDNKFIPKNYKPNNWVIVNTFIYNPPLNVIFNNNNIIYIYYDCDSLENGNKDKFPIIHSSSELYAPQKKLNIAVDPPGKGSGTPAGPGSSGTPSGPGSSGTSSGSGSLASTTVPGDKTPSDNFFTNNIIIISIVVFIVFVVVIVFIYIYKKNSIIIE